MGRRKGPDFLRILPLLFSFSLLSFLFVPSMLRCGKFTSNKLLKSRLSQSKTNEPKNWQRAKRCRKPTDTVILSPSRGEERLREKVKEASDGGEEKWEGADHDGRKRLITILTLITNSLFFFLFQLYDCMIGGARQEG